MTTTSSLIFSSEGSEISTRIEQNFHDIKLAITTAALSSGRTADEVALVAVSKTVGMQEVSEAVRAGMHDFGENRTAALVEKQEAFLDERWHFIGRIQTNKLKDIVGRASLIHSVASLHALEVINRLALAQGICQPILLEVNVSGEVSKDGASSSEVPALLEAASMLKSLEVRGFMTMAPIASSPEDATARRTFAALRELRDNLVPIFAGAENISLNELSMGMSDDFKEAIAEGATIVRIGRRLWS